MPTKKLKKPSLLYRSEYLRQVADTYLNKDDSILEIGSGDGRNVKYLQDHGYTNVTGIDKLHGTSIETVEPKQYDCIFTMSTLFLIPPENYWVFEKIAKMAKKWIFTIEGETGDPTRSLYGRYYSDVFRPYGFEQIYFENDVFNEYGVTRILKRK